MRPMARRRLLQVVARAKEATRTGQDGYGCNWVGIETTESRRQRCRRRNVDRVARFGFD